MKTNDKIERIRRMMREKKIAAVIVPSDDPHGSEYVAEHWQARKWLTGFSGSAGTAVITQKDAILWADFRYYIQAEAQIQNSLFELFKMGEPKVPTFQKWLKDTLKSGDTIGLDGSLFSAANIKKYKSVFIEKEILLDTTINFIDGLWSDRQELPKSQAFSFAVKYAGKTRIEKIQEIRDKMNSFEASYHLMAKLDDIAWTLNLRGDDVHTNPVNISYLLIEPEKTKLFIDAQKVNQSLKEELNEDGVHLYDYSNMYSSLSNIDKKETILIDPENTNFKLYSTVNEEIKIIEKPNPVIGLKAIKNDTEIGHLYDTAVKDGIAVVNFLFWMEQQTATDNVTEISSAGKLSDFRKAQDDFVDDSFDPIMAFQDHSAMCHYSASKESDVVIGDSGLFLSDTGGNYLTGTTDITRTINRGEPLKEEIKDYTLVLKGHMAVAFSLFPQNARGYQIDALARQYLWNEGMDFGHGTGHGVGFFLCVHEGPARISPFPVDIKLKEGMLLTNEPGVYREGKYGIRLENMILVKKAFENEFGTFLKFENMTYCHFENELIDKNLLTQKEINWLNDYHTMVYEKVSPGLEPEVVDWLRQKTMPL